MANRPETDFIYGLNPAFEVIRARRRELHRAWLSIQPNPRIGKLAELLKKANVPVLRVDKHQLFERARTRQHQGVVIETSTYPYTDPVELWGKPRLILLDNIEDPQNTGAILRSAEGMGFGGVLLPTKGVPNVYPSVVKAAAGASEHLAIARSRTANQYVKAAQEHGYRIAALDRSGAIPLPAYQPPPDDTPLLLVVGGEDRAVGQFILNLADDVLKIPQLGRVTSYNASVAAALAMFQIMEHGD